MPKIQTSLNTLWFKPAQLHIGVDWVVKYYVENPANGEHVRKRIKLNRIGNVAQRRKYANALIHEINTKLYSGWNPFLEEMAVRGFDLLVDAMDYYYKTKCRELRGTSLHSYSSFIKIFKEWLIIAKLEKVACITFTKTHAINFARYLYDERNLGNTTWNNYMGFFTILFEWLVANEYCTLNPFKDITKKQKRQKERILIDKPTRAKIEDYFKKTDFRMFIICRLVHDTLLRPNEITQLRLEHFSLKNQTITISNAMSKTKQIRISTIPDELVGHLLDWNFNGAQEKQFIFGQNFLPGTKPINPRRLAKEWSKMRVNLKIQNEMQLYSLRDTGIVQLLNDGISPDEVMKQAGHSSLEMTTVYAKHANPLGSEQIKRKAGK